MFVDALNRISRRKKADACKIALLSLRNTKHAPNIEAHLSHSALGSIFARIQFIRDGQNEKTTNVNGK